MEDKKTNTKIEDIIFVPPCEDSVIDKECFIDKIGCQKIYLKEGFVFVSLIE